MNQLIHDKQGDFASVLDFFKKEIASLRTGQANPNILDAVEVEAYQIKNPINAVANISLENNCMLITPWDKGVIKAIEKGIIEADLGLGIVNEGDKIRLTVPPLTEDNRKDLVKKLNEKMEKARISMRNVRDEIKDDIETAFDNKEISEDDKFRAMKELDELSAKKNLELKEIRDRKEATIMEI